MTFFQEVTGHSTSLGVDVTSSFVLSTRQITLGPPSPPEIAAFTGNSTAAVDERTDNVGVQSLGSINVGNSSVAQMFTIKNIGAADLTGIAATTTNGAEFSVNTSGMSATLAANATTTFTVTFSPSATGVRTGVINIASNDSNENPFRINVSGTGLPSTNADLSNLAISTGTLAPSFDPATTSYTASVPFAITQVTVTPTALRPSVTTISVNGTGVTSGVGRVVPLNVGSNTITTVVTTLDALTTKTYTITVNRPAGVVGDVDPLDASVVGTNVLATAVQPDGKIIIAGSFSSVLGQPRNNIARLHANGTLDLTFDPHANNTVESIALQPDGRIVIGGSFNSLQPNGVPAPTSRFAIARLEANGDLDTTFTPLAGNRVHSVVVQQDGKILLAGVFISVQGTGDPGTTVRQRIARLHANGTLDTDFDPNADGSINTVALQSDGSILIGGNFTSLQPNGALHPTTRQHVARLNPDGTLDPVFDPNANGIVQSIAVQADTQILIGGSFTTLQPNGTLVAMARQRIARVNGSGVLDADFDPTANGDVLSMAVQANGLILVSGSFTTLQPNGAPAPTSRQYVARLNVNGTLDSGFDPKASNFVECITQQADGGILLGGDFTTLQPNGAASPITRDHFVRLVNDAAPQSLAATSISRVEWLRGGVSPETQHVTFELSTDGGVVYSPLGAGSRIAGGWELTGLSLAGNCQIRARARTVGGYRSGSSGLVESVASFTFLPEIAVEQPSGNGLVDDSSTVNWGNVAVGASSSLIFTVRNLGSVNLTGLATSIDGALASNYTVTTSPVAPVAPGGSTTIVVRFAPSVIGAHAAALHIASNDSDEASFDIALSGTGVQLAPVFSSAADIGATSDGFTATGNVIGSITLNFAPSPGTSLMLVNNTGRSFINGAFTNLGQGQAVDLTFGGVTYHFVANYYGGTGNNDLVLQWAGTRAFAWGTNTAGGLGNNSTTDNSVPVPVTASGALAGKTIIAMSAEGNFTLAVCSDGTVAAWGDNVNGQLGNNSTTQSLVPVAVDMTGVLAGKRVIAVSTGASFSLALCSDGTMAAWGSNGNGELGDGSGLESHVPVALNATGVLAGKVVVAIGSGYRQSMAFCSDGTLVAWGSNSHGQLGNNSTINSPVPVAVDTSGVLLGKTVIALSGGDYHSVALCSDGTMASWGYNGNGQFGNGSYAPSIPFPTAPNTSGVLAGRKIIAVATGAYHTVAICDNGTVAAWGYNGYGQLGNNSTTQSPLPVLVDSSGALATRTPIAAAAGHLHSLAVCSDGRIVSWGYNGTGALGDNSLSDRHAPVLVDNTAFVAGERFIRGASDMGSSHSIAIAASPQPEIRVEQPVATNLTSGVSIADFGMLPVGGSTSLTFTIRNTGNGSLTGLAVSFGGSAAGDYAASAVPATVAPAGSTTCTVTFSPSAIGIRNAVMHIASNDADENPFDVALTGSCGSSNANLSALTTSAGALTPAFASGTFSYTAPSVWNTPAAISVTPTVADATATLQVRVNGGGFVPALSGSASIVALNEGSNAIDVKVTAQDAVTIRTYTLTVTRHAPGQGPPVTVMTSAVNPPPGVPGANWDSIRSGMALASGGAIAFRGHLDIIGSVTADNFQGIWKSPDGTGPSTALVARSGITLAPGTGGALYDILPVNPIINDAAQTTFLSFLRANTGSPLVNTSTDSGVWSELGGTGLKLLLREGDMIGSDTVSTVAPSGTVAGSNTSAAFTVKLATGSALVRVDMAGASVSPVILAKEGGSAPAIGGGAFGPFDSFAGNASDPRMDAVGDLAFLSLIQTGGGGIWYEPTGPAGTLTAVATTGEATPGGIADTFAAFERPTLANSTLIAFRAFLTTSGQSVFKGNPSSPASLVPVAVSRDTTAQIPTIPAGSKLWSIWSPFSNSLGHLAFRVSLLDAVSAETRAVVTDTGGSLAVIAKVGDIAPGAGAETFGNFSHPIIGDGDQAAFLASTDAGTLGLWRQSSGGGALALVMKIGDTVDVGGSTETIAEIIVPGTGSDDRKFETKTMDAAGHILVYVVYNSGKTGVLLTPP